MLNFCIISKFGGQFIGAAKNILNAYEDCLNKLRNFIGSMTFCLTTSVVMPQFVYYDIWSNMTMGLL